MPKMISFMALSTATGAMAIACVTSAIAGEVTIENVAWRLEAGGHHAFSVTLRHTDTGWDRYANEWRGLAPDGSVLGVHTLRHPHGDEQAFTRPLSGIALPSGTRDVLIDVRDSRHGRSKKLFTLTLSKR